MIELMDFEKHETVSGVKERTYLSEEDVNLKYSDGEKRVVTETGAYKLPSLMHLFKQKNYNLLPSYQRRVTWDRKKRSKLIESFIINIPVPPVFLYEIEYDKYEVMDGLQRISTIVDFYSDKFPLSGLEEWPELNGKKYSMLPKKVKEGIDRRQLMIITLLKETAFDDDSAADRIKRLVFERLNTGGETLRGQEVRNAVFPGDGNEMCKDLSKSPVFQKLWGLSSFSNDEVFTWIDNDDNGFYVNEDDNKKLLRATTYKRMLDVELVLRFFAMRNIDDFNCSLNNFLDNTLIKLNRYEEEDLNKLKLLFENTTHLAFRLLKDKAFCVHNGEKWSAPQRLVYDPLIIALMSRQIVVPEQFSSDDFIEKYKDFFNNNVIIEKDGLKTSLFDGKHQSQDDIKKRANKIVDFLKESNLYD